MITVELCNVPRFAPVSPELARDPGVSDSAVRLWTLLFHAGMDHRPIDLEGLAESWPGGPVNVRTVSRWLAQLDAAGWATWTRARGTRRGLDGRVAIHAAKQARTSAEQAEKFGHYDPNSLASSDTTIRTRASSDPGVTSSDTTIRTPAILARPDAENRASSNRLDPYTTTTMGEVPANDRPAGGGGEKAPPKNPDHHPETAVILEAAGVLSAVSFQDIPPDVARAAVKQAKTHRNPTNFGGLVASLLIKFRTGAWTPPPARKAPAPEPAPAEPERILTAEERRASFERWQREHNRWTGVAS